MVDKIVSLSREIVGRDYRDGFIGWEFSLSNCGMDSKEVPCLIIGNTIVSAEQLNIIHAGMLEFIARKDVYPEELKPAKPEGKRK
jgi:hypothetical protein